MSRSDTAIYLPRTWRSEIITVVVFVVMSFLAVFLSHLFPWSVIEGELFPLGESSLRMHLPLFWFIPFLTIGSAMYRIYNVRYVLSERGIEAEVGILALQRRLIRVWFEDIRSVQIRQTLLNRLLGVGDIEISTAATGSIEVILRGISAPGEVQEMVQRERDKRQKSQRFQKNNQNNSEERSIATA
ncbi:MAG: PH domain-containing protein [Bdellovibrionales bacterium]|nr:PH domain-containing protein [Bdellovibrionales bacterium]